MIIFRQFLTKQNKSILSAQYLVLGVQIACGVWWAGGVFWQKKHVLSSRGHPNKDGKNSECSEHIRAIFCHHMLILGQKGAFALILAVFTLILAFLPLMEQMLNSKQQWQRWMLRGSLTRLVSRERQFNQIYRSKSSYLFFVTKRFSLNL